MMPRRSALALALTLSACAPDALAQPASRAARDARATARTIIVVGGIMVSVGFVMSWTGIGGLVWEATQHESVRWAAPLSIASVPVEIVGSILVAAGAIELLGHPSPDVTSSEPLVPTVATARPVFSLPLVQAEF
jgi:hypothetical protein